MVTVAKLGNVSKAADYLHISQPSLSQFIQKVENECGYPIFIRQSRTLKLSDIGKLYIRTCVEMLQLEKDLRNKMDDLSNLKTGELTIGITSHRSPYMLPDILDRFRSDYPGIKLSIIEKLSTDELEEITLQGETDLFISTTPLKNNNLKYVSICKEELHLVVPRYCISSENNYDHLSIEEVITFLRNHQDFKYVLPTSSMKMHRLIRKLFSKAEITPNIYFETSNMDTGIAMAARGLCSTFTFRTLNSCIREKRPVYIPINAEEFSTFLAVGYTAARYLCNAANAFISTMQKCYNDKNILCNKRIN